MIKQSRKENNLESQLEENKMKISLKTRDNSMLKIMNQN